MNLYNEIDPYAAQWLRNLGVGGHIPDGIVDERSIVELKPADLAGYTHCHFFAGIGGWAYALHLAGWPVDRPVWTGSCPCQPFSSAGARRGNDDARHLWPAWFRLIRECAPAVVFGEQVASRAGAAWLDAVLTDLEGAGYAVAAADLPAAGVGAPHGRARLYFVADANPRGWQTVSTPRLHADGQPGHDPARCGAPVDHPAWAAVQWLDGKDGRRRPSEPGAFPLVDGVPADVGRLRAYGNAIVPQVAAAFVTASMRALC